MSFWTADENSDSSGYIRRASPTRTTAMPLACSVVIFMRLVLLDAVQRAPAALHRPAAGAAAPGRPRTIGYPPVRQLRRTAQPHRGPQREGERFERLPQLRAQILMLGHLVR